MTTKCNISLDSFAAFCHPVSDQQLTSMKAHEPDDTRSMHEVMLMHRASGWLSMSFFKSTIGPLRYPLYNQ